ncbi:flagellin [Endozoicomonas sp. Mp262]|uniref:flagellin n=1 Tax=Endozoicomonas sp. Mp262 TaxID=2919499 RepID=UPI0021D8ED56
MALTVNTNVASINAQRNMMTTQSGLQTAMTRLSSGLRINSAKDDAAGLQISNRLNSQIKGLGVAIRNANDGISLAQTAEGAMQEVTNILQRVRELALQSANGSNDAADRTALQAEVTEMRDEVTRIANTTTYGTKNLLDGSTSTLSFQVGAYANQTVSMTLSDLRATSLGTTTGKSMDLSAAGYDNTVVGAAAETLTFAITNDTGTHSVDVAVALGDGFTELTENVNAALNQHGVYAEISGGDIKMVAENTVTQVDVSSSIAGDAGVFSSAGGSNTVTLGAADSDSIGGALSTITVTTQSGAQSSIAIIDQAIAAIDSQRSTLGAVQNRLTSTINNLSNVRESVSASRSRIIDADFAAETASLTKFQILQQSGAAILSQANTSPQIALSLL